MWWEELDASVNCDTGVIRLAWPLLRELKDKLSIVCKGRRVLSTGLMLGVEGTLFTCTWG